MRDNLQRTKRSYGIRLTALLLVLVLSLPACGKKQESVPELLEPVSTNQAYRPVTYGDIGNRVIKNGCVVPTDYCHFFQATGDITEIYVTVGQYVTAGTVLAEIDGGELGDSISDMKQSLEDQKAAQEINQKIYNENQKKYDYMIKACDEFGDTEGAEALRLEKATAAENNRYDEMLFHHQIQSIETQIAEMEEVQSDTTLVARHSGYVTFVKDITTSTSVSNGENIVIVSDYDQPYIEITGEQVGKKDAYEIFQVMYTMIEGQRYEIETYDYTNEELAAAQSASSLPYVRFQLTDGDRSLLKVGNTIPLYFTTSNITNVLIIGSDSLYTEGEETFVYVKTEDNPMERRDIVIGESDNNNVQVLEGLSEGELVAYVSDSPIPSNYTEYTVSLGNYSQLTSSDASKNKMEDTHMVSYYAPCDGYFTEFSLLQDQWVNKGDLLFVIDSGGGSAELKQLDIDIAHAKEDYNASIEDIDAQIAELDRQIAAYRAGRIPDTWQEEDDEIATDGDAVPEPMNILYMAEQLTCDKQILSYNKELTTLNYNSQMRSMSAQRDKLNENNDGYGNISVYAENDGYVKSIDIYGTSTQVAAGDRVVAIGAQESMVLMVTSAKADNPIEIVINQEVYLEHNSDASQTLTGRCIGASGDSSKSYITTLEDGSVYVTHSESVEGTRKYYVVVDDPSFYEEVTTELTPYTARVAAMALEQVVTVPPNMVYHEKRKTDGKDFDYVWKVVDGELVKQYVTLGPSYERSVCILSGLSEGDVLARENAE